MISKAREEYIRGGLSYEGGWGWSNDDVAALLDTIDELRVALEKIADPRKRTHQEMDKYTELGCVMNIASEALENQ